MKIFLLVNAAICGLAVARTCKDRASNCDELKGKCDYHVAEVREFVQKHCAYSCGLCSSGQGSKVVARTCKDLASNCDQLKEKCNYHIAEVREFIQKHCAYSCGLCSSTPAPVMTRRPQPPPEPQPEPVGTSRPQPPPSPQGGLSCPGGLLTTQQRQMLLDDHNSKRSNLANGREYINSAQGYAPSASNMYKLSWDCNLENGAQRWAETCPELGPYAHSKGNHGENLHWSWTTGKVDTVASMKMATTKWWAELQKYGMVNRDYVYTEAVGLSGVGHFTQMAWGSTTKVGCGVTTRCPQHRGMNTVIVCCQYQLQGNFENRKIYEQGSPCRSNSDCTTFNGSTCETSTGLCVAA